MNVTKKVSLYAKLALLIGTILVLRVLIVAVQCGSHRNKLNHG